MELIIVAAEAVDDGLLRRGLVAHDPIRLAVLRGRLALRRAGDPLREIGPSRLCAKVERAALYETVTSGRTEEQSEEDSARERTRHT